MHAWRLPGRCDQGNGPLEYFNFTRHPGSVALGINPQGKYMGGEEGMGHVYGHWPILFDAGGTYRVQGDFLFRDYAPNGNRNGQFGLMRVSDGPVPYEPPGDGGDPPPPPDDGEDPPPPDDGAAASAASPAVASAPHHRLRRRPQKVRFRLAPSRTPSPEDFR